MNDESSLARNRTALAISSAWPNRFIGVALDRNSLSVSPRIGVSINPGQIAFTRILRSAYSRPSERVSE